MDHIKNLLSQTGWSYDELIQKLNEFKNSPPVDAKSSSSKAQQEPERSRHEFKESNADSSSTHNVHHELNHKEESESQQVPKNCFQCDVDSSLTPAQNAGSKGPQGLLQCNQIESDKESESHMEIKQCSLNNVDVDASSAGQTNKEERNENEQEFKSCDESQEVFNSGLPCGVNSSLTPSQNQGGKGPQGFLQCNQIDRDKEHERQAELKYCSSNNVDVDASSTGQSHKEEQNELSCGVKSSLTPSQNEESKGPQGLLQCSQIDSDKDNERPAELRECSLNNVDVDASSTGQSNKEERNENEHEFKECGESHLVFESCLPCDVDSSLTPQSQNERAKGPQGFIQCNKIGSDEENESRAEPKECSSSNAVNAHASSAGQLNEEDQNENEREFKTCSRPDRPSNSEEEEKEDDESQQNFQTTTKTDDAKDCELKILTSSSTEQSKDKEEQNDVQQECKTSSPDNLNLNLRSEERDQPNNNAVEKDVSQQALEKCKVNLNPTETHDVKDCGELKIPRESSSSTEQTNTEERNEDQQQEFKKWPPSNSKSGSRQDRHRQSNSEEEDEIRQDLEKCNSPETHYVEHCGLKTPCNNENASSTEQSNREERNQNEQEFEKCNLNSSSRPNHQSSNNDKEKEGESQQDFEKCKAILNLTPETHDAKKISCESTEQSCNEKQDVDRQEFKENSPLNLKSSSSQEEHRQLNIEEKDKNRTEFEKLEVNYLNSVETGNAEERGVEMPCHNENTCSTGQSNKEERNGNRQETKNCPPSNSNSSSRLEERHQSNSEGEKGESRQVNLNPVGVGDVEECELTMPCNNKITSSTEQTSKEELSENQQESQREPASSLNSSLTQEPNNQKKEEGESQVDSGLNKANNLNSTDCELKMPREKSNKEEQIEGREEFKEPPPVKLDSNSRQEEHEQSSSEGGKEESQRDFEKCEVNLNSAETRSVEEQEFTVPCDDKNESSTEQPAEEELKKPPPCNSSNSSSRQDDSHQPNNEEEEEESRQDFAKSKMDETRYGEEHELSMPDNNKNLSSAEQSSKEKRIGELKQQCPPPCNLNSILRQEEHRQSHNEEETEDFQKCTADLNSTETLGAKNYCELKIPCSNKDTSSTEQSCKEEQRIEEFKKWPPCNSNSSSRLEERSHRPNNEGEEDESRWDFEKCKADLNSNETCDTKECELKVPVPCNNTKRKEGQSEELKKCNLNSSSRHQEEHHHQSSGEGEENKSGQDFAKCQAESNSRETHDAAEEHDFKVPRINKNTSPPAQCSVKKSKPKNKDVDASDHNYIKKDCEQNNYIVNSPRGNFAKTKSAKVTNFRNRFLYRIKRSYRIRSRHKNVKRSQLIPRQSRRNTEGVRNQILQQLELLRNRRSSDFGRDLHQTIAPGLAEPLLYKKRLSNEKAKNDSTSISASSTTTNQLEEAAINEFMTEQAPPLRVSNDGNEDFYTIKPTKTKDITKIKGWKHKKFASLELSAAKNCSFIPVKSTPSCSFEEDKKTNENIPCEKQEASEPAATSAFASNNLDGFLYESANLQISFQIPKLASGEDCPNSAPAVPVASTIVKPQIHSEPEEEDDQDENVESSIISGDRENLLKIHKITNLYKPRTVGQRKRIWRLKNDARVKQDESMRKPRTLAEKRRLMDVGGEDSKYSPPVKRSASETNFFDEDLKYSYVLFRGKKLRVPTPTEKGIIAYIKYSYNKREYIYVPKKRKISPNKNKPSIFNTNSIVKSHAIKYRPGPLCKKLELQEYNKTWRTVIKKLPKVYLEVTPEVNRPIHPGLLHLLPDYQFELTPSRVEFALSALYEKKKVTFKFPLAYANHEESLLFREKILPEDVKPSPPQDSEMLMTDVIKDVVSKMLDYVETKDLADEIFIKEDVVNVRCRDEEVSVSAPTKAKPMRKPKKSKTNYELKRLNVKVIEVDLEDKGGDIVNCNKDYCKLGCVCKSLATTSSLVSNHCGIPDCMFECTCNYDRKSRGNLKITLPVGIDVLSEGAVSRLEDEAKKNLARFEKEFTQTVIQANNQTIVVGGHCNRQRRLTKAPRKYNDFIDDPDLLLENMNEPEETPEPVEEVHPEIEWKPCFVKLPRLKLEQLIPFCLVHNLHNCHCGYKAQFKVMPVAENKLLFKRTLESNTQNTSDECLPKSSSSASSLNPECYSSARTRGISTSYYLVRNRTREFMWTRKKKLERLYKDYLDMLSLSEPVDFYLHSEIELSKSQKEKDETIEVEDDTKQVSRSTRRKQQLTVREDTINLQAAKKSEQQQQQKKKPVVEKPKPKPTKPKQTAKPEEKKSVAPEPPTKQAKQVEEVIAEPPVKTIAHPTPSELNNVVRDDTLPKFENLLLSSKHTTELLTPSSAVREKFLQLLGKKNECDAQFRLMPWSGLASRYETDQLQLWYSTYYKVPKIIVSDSILAPKQFTNVKQFENVQDKSQIKIDLIRWLVMKTVPGGKCSDDVLVILQLTKTHCEVCGICEKSQSTENMLLALIPSSLTQNKDPKESTETIEVNNLFNLETADDQKKQHVIAKKIKFSKCKYPEVTLQELEGPDSFLATQQKTAKWFITTHLPNVNKNSQWRMVQLNSDFSVLSLLRNSYAIKYSDLLRIVRMSQATYTTIVLKTPEVEQNYPHPDFGIYAAPNCEEKIFIGPYFYYESHDVSTLRYVNRVLVKTELFNQMKGKAPTNNGCWLKQVQEGQRAQKKSLQTIDLTMCDSDNETEFIETQTQDVRVKYTPSPRSLLKHPLSTSTSSSNNGDKEQQELSVTQPNKSAPVSSNKPQEEAPSSEKSIFTIDDVANFEMSAVDFDVKDSSGDCVLEEDNAVNVRSFENQLYLVPNVPLMGYILAHKLRNITIVRWPTLNNAKRFYRIEEAVLWLEKELSDYFIVPPNFRIKIRVKTDLAPRVSEPFDPKYLKGYYLATKYGVKSLLNVNVQTLKLLEVTSKELELLARRRAKKMIYDKCCDIAKQFIPSETLKAKSCSEVIDMITSEIKMQRRAESFYIDKQQKLLSKKEKLVDSLSSVIKDISPFVSNKTQTAMLDILKRHKVPPPPQNPTTDKPPTPEKDSDVVCITIDSDDEASADSVEKVPPPKPVETPPPVIPKITVRNLHDLRDPNLSKPLDIRELLDSNTSKLPADYGSTVIVTKRKRSDVLKALRLNTAGSNPISFDTKFEKIHLFPLTNPTSKNLTPDSSAGVKENSTAAPPTSMSEDIVTVPQESRGVKRKLKPTIFPTISKCIIKTPAGKLIRVNAEQLKSIQNKGIILTPVTKEVKSPENGMTVFTNHSSHGGFVKLNLDNAISTQILRKVSDTNTVQPSGSS